MVDGVSCCAPIFTTTFTQRTHLLPAKDWDPEGSLFLRHRTPLIGLSALLNVLRTALQFQTLPPTLPSFSPSQGPDGKCGFEIAPRTAKWAKTPFSWLVSGAQIVLGTRSRHKVKRRHRSVDLENAPVAELQQRCWHSSNMGGAVPAKQRDGPDALQRDAENEGR